MKIPVTALPLVFLIVSSIKAMAAIAPTSVSFTNASVVVRPSSTTSTTTTDTQTSGNFKVYGGIAGPSCTTGDTGDNTCNNCGGSNTPCNLNRINDQGSVVVTFTSNSASSFTASSTVKVLNGTTLVNSTIQTTSIAVNSPIVLEIQWDDICVAMGLSNCAVGIDTYKTLKIGIDTNNDDTLEEFFSVDFYLVGDSSATNDQFLHPCPGTTSATADEGYCDLEVFKGDQKVYILNEAHADTFNQSPWGVEYKYLRVFYEKDTIGGGCADANFTQVKSNSSYQDLTFSERNGQFYLDNAKITDLENDQLYYFRFGNVDEAGNVYFFSADSVETADPTLQYLTCSRHSAIPSEVVGLLDGKECFIATAALGSSMAPELKTLRLFRDQVLKKSTLGRWFVKSYYSVSPEWALWLKKNEGMKDAVRAVLRPITSFVQFILIYGIQSLIILSLLGFALGFFLVRRLMRQHG